ncbi:XdhC family protein [Acidisoma cellulosilytica]|uniref:XdhC family protein n=1 Tax=Acidisoma cellulosilyticum TaxID=2802395 RepID=A0A963Z797_9PROT|nr:XdhC/CoxI family protein [Acidisoma cellulosilyticum]MCB8883133.1 XdhC family protein [Acidisoma cellulosilyticum]
MGAVPDLTELMAAMKRQAQPFALATVVRTASATAAKAGAKAVILADGTVTAGWIGGGCARGAVLRAARAALADGQPRLISVQPEDQLQAHHVVAGEIRDGVEFARNACASQGVMDIFVEPVLPLPRLRVHGASPVALVLLRLAPEFGFAVTAEGPAEALGQSEPTSAQDYVVVATQGRGDIDALKAALAADATYTAFVGSTRKVATLKAAMLAEGYTAAQLARLHGPAGMAIGAVTAEEIALSILAEMVRERRGRPSAAKADNA